MNGTNLSQWVIGAMVLMIVAQGFNRRFNTPAGRCDAMATEARLKLEPSGFLWFLGHLTEKHAAPATPETRELCAAVIRQCPGVSMPVQTLCRAVQ